MSRTKNVSKNLYISMICYVSSIVLGFVSRSFFIMFLDIEYLGVNGLFTNILTFLSLAELGVGSAIVYALYKPLADNDRELIKTYMSIYKKVYSFIGCFVGVVGLCLIPFLPYLISGETDIKNLEIIYVLFVLNSASSYFFSYNQSLLNADQKVYIIKVQYELFKVTCQIIQIIFLFLTREYLIFLIISIIFTLLTNVSLYIKTIKEYPFLKEKNINPLDKDRKDSLVVNIKSIFLHKIGTVLVYNVDTIIISAFLGLTITGIYSNYILIITSVSGIIALIEGSIRASLGNYVAKESSEKSYSMFKMNDFMWFSIYIFCSVCLINLLNPFIGDIWIRDTQYLFDFYDVLIIVINFFIAGLRKNVLMFKDLYGVFAPDRYKPIIEGVVNLILSLIFVKIMGFSGVLIATIITNVLICFTVEPYVLFKHGLKQNVRKYYLNLIYHVFSAIIIIGLSIFLSNFISGNDILSFVLKGLISVMVATIGIICFYCKTDEFKNIINLLKRFISSAKIKIKK